MHMFQLGQCLIERGHKVVVMSNTYSKERLGVRYVSNGMKVYHLPLLPFSSQDSFASFMFLMCILRKICIREQIDIVHGHQTTALLNIVSLLHGATLGKKVPAVSVHLPPSQQPGYPNLGARPEMFSRR